MFGTYFYHQTSRKMVVAFGTLFNNIEVRRTDSADAVVEVIKIPLSYGPKDKMLVRISQDPNLNSKVALTVPRMGFELTSMTYDGARKLNTMGRNVKKGTTGLKKQFNPVPYNWDFSLYVFVKNAEDGTQILEQILENKIVAVCRGRMEMGQRSLGNRSIIADPRTRSNVEKINNSIKKRDFWMPFAPVILEEYQDLLIKNPKKIDSPFMTITFETKDGKNKFPAAVHQADGTARAQLLKKEQNPILWSLIFKFYEKTGIPALLNTSFNLHGEPIVRTIQDALRVFDKSELEVLWLDEHIIEKK